MRRLTDATRETVVLQVPDGADVEKAQARFENGVLEVTIPVRQEANRGRQIEIVHFEQAYARSVVLTPDDDRVGPGIDHSPKRRLEIVGRR